MKIAEVLKAPIAPTIRVAITLPTKPEMPKIAKKALVVSAPAPASFDRSGPI